MDDKDNAKIEVFVAAGGDFRQWSVAEWIGWEGRWNIKPTQDVPVLFVHKNELRFDAARWSLVPSWAKDLKLKFPTFNARSESITTKATWRAPVKSTRVIILANGYYEWQTVGKTKTPYFIHNPAIVGDQALVDEAVRAGASQESQLDFYQVAPLVGDGPELLRPV